MQVIAAMSLGLSYFLPFYASAAGKIRYVDQWFLFFWAFPAVFIIYKLSNRWLKAGLCFLSVMGGLLDLFLVTFLATFKSTPLVGFNTAKISIIILVISWFALGVLSLSAPRHKQAETDVKA